MASEWPEAGAPVLTGVCQVPLFPFHTGGGGTVCRDRGRVFEQRRGFQCSHLRLLASHGGAHFLPSLRLTLNIPVALPLRVVRGAGCVVWCGPARAKDWHQRSTYLQKIRPKKRKIHTLHNIDMVRADGTGARHVAFSLLRSTFVFSPSLFSFVLPYWRERPFPLGISER
ncbi:hypothetical protein LY76DRAFT_431595 [Colletotrichum caudatum]|nr:hypothetical protein LY76DRAFT_431595 [Colletotrichum caudatum]